MHKVETTPAWRFWAALGVQVLIVLTVPLPKVAAYTTGTPVVLRTVPVDPLDFLRGRYVRLNYEIATSEEAGKLLPTWPKDGEPVYFTLKPGSPAWTAVAVSARWPATVPPGCVVLAGTSRWGGATFGLEEYYLPEDQGDALADAMTAHATGNLAELKVDGRGTAVLTGFVVDKQRF